MKRKGAFILIAFALACTTACGGFGPAGYLYTNTIRPLDANVSRTPSGVDNGKGDVKHLHYYVDVMWDSNAIGDIVRKSGLREVYYADLEIVRVIGIWHQYTVHVYGREQAREAPHQK